MYFNVLDFTDSGRMRFERFYLQHATPERRGELDQAMDECLSRLEDMVNAGGVLAWQLPAHYAHSGSQTASFFPSEVDLVIEGGAEIPNALAGWARPKPISTTK
ncbi:hypothetical protein ACIPRI_05180 [Variovorax sp. LARHSF232]